jgi:hypothetical protein
MILSCDRAVRAARMGYDDVGENGISYITCCPPVAEGTC